MFQITQDELDDLRCKNFTANIISKNRTLLHTFTEQCIYMLMTVLKAFKAMKDLSMSQDVTSIQAAGMNF